MNFNYLRNETIGYGSYFDGPFGKRLITYTDYTASGKSLKFLENYYIKLQETYANTHTEDDYTGRRTTQLYHDAKRKIIDCVGANENYKLFSVGTGTTAAIEKLSKIIGIYRNPEREHAVNDNNTMDEANNNSHKKNSTQNHSPVVFISSYEHHSNELMWREGNAEVVKIKLTNEGLFDLEDLKVKVSHPAYKNRLKIGSFSAGSNVTGLKKPVYDIARIMHDNKGFVFFDFAASGPYVEINLTYDDEAYFDGIYLSMHKFLGGPGSSGLLIMNKGLYNKNLRPCAIGGGTVKYVTHDDHVYLDDIESREDAGTPGIMQTIRSAMALELKDAIGIKEIEKKENEYIKRGLEALGEMENVVILGNCDHKNRLPIISFNIKYKDGYLHHGFITNLLNDLFGIQARAGCACAAPYGFKLLNIDNETVEYYKKALDADVTAMKPGWTRLNFHYTLDEATFDFLIEAIRFVANHGHEFLHLYKLSYKESSWSYRINQKKEISYLSLTDALTMKKNNLKPNSKIYKREYKKYLKNAYKLLRELEMKTDDHVLFGKDDLSEIAWFYHCD